MMKRDMDLIRALLLAVESSGTAKLRRLPAFDGHDEDTVAEHTRLAFEAGLLDGASMQPLSGPPQFANIGLTWRGHEFLNSVRDPEIWDQAKAGANKVGSFSFTVLSELAIAYAKAKAASLGIPML